MVAITAGELHTCAVSSAGAAKCWGSNLYGQLGSAANSGNDNPNDIPRNVQTLGSSVVAIAAGNYHTCALTSFGWLKCWGWNRYGQLGSPVNSGNSIPNDTPFYVQTLSNNLRGQSITFAPPATLPRGANLSLSATASSGEPVSFDTWTPQTCTIVGNTLTVTARSLCGVRASQPGSDNYAAAPQQLRLIQIQRNDVLTLNVVGQGSVEVSPDPAAGGIDACSEADSPCTAAYADADAINLDLSATRAINWHWAGWSGDCAVDSADPLLAKVILDADKSCVATFAINTYTLTYSAGPNGTIGGSSPQTVNHGASGSPVSAVANAGYHFVQWSDGSTVNPRTDSAVTADISVKASFAINRYTVTASAGANGSITPAIQTVDHGATASFTVTAASSYYVHIVTGDTCTLSHVNANSWSTGAISANCTISASFVDDSKTLVLTIEDARNYARYGQLLTYVVTLGNQGTSAASAVSIAMSLPPQLDAQNSTWTCLGAGGGATCSASGAGALADASVTIPAGRSLTWLVSTPVRVDAGGATIDVTITASDGINSANASDSNILVILRNSFDVPDSDGTQADGVFDQLAQCAVEQAETLDDAHLDIFALPPAQKAFDTVLVARGESGAGFRIERSSIEAAQVRLVVVAANGSESASAWTPVEPDALLALTTIVLGEGQRSVVLEGAASLISLLLPGGASKLWHLRMQRTESDCH